MLRPLLLLPLALLLACQPLPEPREQWSEQEAADWWHDQPWLVGVNYVPATAGNQLEMWQAESWDPDTIDVELGWASDLGFNTARVFLHDLVWDEDPEAYVARIDAFLAIADDHGVGVMLVLFDGVWDPEPVAGLQPDPTPGVHNSTWVQGPGRTILGDASAHAGLEGYVRGVVAAFGQDERVVVWDLFNELNNPNLTSYGEQELDVTIKAERTLELLTLTRTWALDEGPIQPLTAGVYVGQWADPAALTDLNDFMLHRMDVNSFHSYRAASPVRDQVFELEQYGRPLLCTEYMARPEDSTFEAILPIFDDHSIGAYSWGLVDGRSQTKYAWDSWNEPVIGEPELWFHDVLRADGTPYIEAEADYLRGVLGAR